MVLAVAFVFFAAGVVVPMDGWWRALSIVGLALTLLGARAIVGPVVVVRPEGLRLQPSWPRRRDIPWYRILSIDVIPGFWYLEIELNSGERVALPCVQEIDELYEEMERYRQALDV